MLEKFHLGGGGRGWGNQDPGDPGVVKVRGGKDFFPSSRGGGTDPEWHYVWFLKQTTLLLIKVKVWLVALL